jgi:phage host-nuclease inhibitor protein Gam
MAAKQLAQDLQNQIDLLDSDYNQMIGITEEEYIERKQALEYELEDLQSIVEEQYGIINDLVEE